MPNFLASVAMLLWIPAGLGLFAVLRPPIAASVAIIGASLLLPCGFEFKIAGLPELNRELIASLAALAGCLVFAPHRLRGRHPGQGVELLAVAVALGAFGTMLTNGDPRGLSPALTSHDAISTAVRELLRYWLPFFVGRALFRSASELRPLLIVLTVAGVLYSVPILWEARMSPQLHEIVYGYAPASFGDQMRSGGYRPMVFIGHGLALAMFVLSAAIAAFGLARTRETIAGFSARLAAGWLFAILIACRSAAALVYGIVVAPLLFLLRPAAQARIIVVVAGIVVLYPALRALDWFPTTTLIEVARFFSEERAASLEFRFVNEDALLTKARERIWFGWGGWGRSLPPETIYGRVITDGFWIIILGQSGVVGYVGAFGILLAPALLAARRIQRIPPSAESVLLVTTSWIVVLNAVDLLPNGFLTARAIFLGGALTGALQGGRNAAASSLRRRSRNRASAKSRAVDPPASTAEPDDSLGSRLTGRRRGRRVRS